VGITSFYFCVFLIYFVFVSHNATLQDFASRFQVLFYLRIFNTFSIFTGIMLTYYVIIRSLISNSKHISNCTIGGKPANIDYFGYNKS
jgi:hypothetical protein